MSWTGHQKQSPGKHGSRIRGHHDGKPSRSNHSERYEAAPKSSPASPLEFLFVVNEVNLNTDTGLRGDVWGNTMPPDDAAGFATETVGGVFRYMNGHVSSVAGEYFWYRDPQQGSRGNIQKQIVMDDGTGRPVYVYEPQQPYQTRTVFHCGPFVPHVHGGGDASVADLEEHYEGHFDGWRALHFDHNESGVSRIGSRYKHVAGDSPSWLDHHQIISGLYRRPRNVGSASPSQGLGGEVAIVIGLMALSQRRGQIDAAFANRLWNNNRWTGQLHPDAWPPANGDPRGVVVHVALDPNPARCQALSQALDYVDSYQVWLQG